MRADARLSAMRMLRKWGLRPEVENADGYYMWVGLPDGIDDIELTRQAARESIFLAPGSVFELDGQRTERRFLRLNIAYVSDPRFHDFARRALKSGGN